MATNTSGHILVADGTNYNPVAVSGDVTINGSGAVTIAATSVENSMLAGSIANAKLANDSVSYGGISLDLGGTDATPAFNLCDATAYKGDSALVTVGTITSGTWNGTAIANANLANDSVSYGGVSLDLGTTDATPAFNLCDATAYKGDSALVTVGTIASGTWNGTAIASAYLDSDTAHLSGTQTFSGAKTFSAATQFSNTVTVGVDDTGYDVKFFGATSGRYLLWDEANDRLKLRDNTKVVFGQSNDLEIYHDATDSIIDNSTGKLKVLSDKFRFNNAADSESMLIADADAAVKLYYNGSAKIETTNTGIDVTGEVKGDSLDIDGDVSLDGGTFVFNESGADKDFRIEGDTEQNLFFADASTDRIGIGTAAPDGPLHIMSASAGTVTADANADELVIEGSGNAGLTILSANSSQGNIAFGDDGNAKQGVFGFHQGNAEFNWSQAAQQMVLDSSGRLSVGYNGGLQARLQLYGAYTAPASGVGLSAAFLTSSDGGACLRTRVAFLQFGGIYNTGGDVTQWAAIQGLKENATSDDVAGYLSFVTRGSSIAERMRILSSGAIMVGKTASNVGVVGTQIEAGGNMNLTASGDRLLGLESFSEYG